MSELPAGWMTTTLEVATKVIRGITFPATAKEPVPTAENVCCLRTANIQKEVTWGDVYYVDRQYVKREEQFVQAGDILMSMANSYELVGKVAHVKSVPSSTAFGAFLSAVRPTPVIDGRYLFHFLRSDRVQLELREGSSQTTNIANISVGRLNTIALPLAPRAEQTRIADQLDTLLARIKACNDHLDTIPALLKRFRQAVVRAAATGQMTRAWRDAQDQAVPAWQVLRIKDVGRVQLGRQRAPQFHSGAHMRPYLRVQNVFENRIDLSDVMEMDFPPEDYERYRLHPGDILLNEGQSPEYLGRPAIYRGELPGACFTNTLIRFQCGPSVLPEFALTVFRHHMHSGRYVREGKITTNLAHLGAGRFADVEFPLPSLDEQREIVRLVVSFSMLAESIEARYRKMDDHTKRLSPQVLAKAFRGELLPQDPIDEPASALIARLAEARNQATATPKTRKDRAPRAERTLPSKSSPSNTMPNKSRQDEDVKGQPYLAGHLLRLGQPVDAKTLYEASELPVADFYKQLAWEIAEGHVNDADPLLEPARHAA